MWVFSFFIWKVEIIIFVDLFYRVFVKKRGGVDVKILFLVIKSYINLSKVGLLFFGRNRLLEKRVFLLRGYVVFLVIIFYIWGYFDV